MTIQARQRAVSFTQGIQSTAAAGLVLLGLAGCASGSESADANPAGTPTKLEAPSVGPIGSPNGPSVEPVGSPSPIGSPSLPLLFDCTLTPNGIEVRTINTNAYIYCQTNRQDDYDMPVKRTYTKEEGSAWEGTLVYPEYDLRYSCEPNEPVENYWITIDLGSVLIFCDSSYIEDGPDGPRVGGAQVTSSDTTVMEDSLGPIQTMLLMPVLERGKANTGVTFRCPPGAYNGYGLRDPLLNNAAGCHY